ncbi:unnamed protein product [Caenorhabditis brenneri]
MDKPTAVQPAHQILSCDQPELLAVIVAQFSAAHDSGEQNEGAQEEATPVIQQRQNAAPHLDAIFTRLLQDYQLIMLRNIEKGDKEIVGSSLLDKRGDDKKEEMIKKN